jgi:hypothetical protein
MKKLIRVTVAKDVLKRFDADVKDGRRAEAVAARIEKHRARLVKRSKAKATLFQNLSTLVDEKDIALLKRVAEAEGRSMAEVLGELLA